MAESKKPKEPDLSHITEGLRVLAVPIETLNFDPKNARKHSERNIQAIKSSLRRFGQRDPLKVQKDGMIVKAGNGRLQAMLEEGWTHVAALVIDENGLDAAAYALADNRTGELAEWDVEALEEITSELDDDLLDDIGFSEAELDAFLVDDDEDVESAAEPSKEKDAGEAAEAEPTEKKEKKPPAKPINPQYAVMVQCANEDEQRKLHDRLVGEKFQVKLLTV